MPAVELAEAIPRKEVSPVEAVGAVRERIAKLDPQVNAFGDQWLVLRCKGYGLP
jgi:Asp-tRNA(Asn)/Glu-tRNA(Gln) amidotransferase A subunit family amidase